LDESLEETLRDCLQVLVKEEGPEVSDCENNGILLKEGLSPEVSMPSVPLDWTPPRSQKQVKANQPLIVLTIQDSGPNTLIHQTS
jgi:hypothetical protein